MTRSWFDRLSVWADDHLNPLWWWRLRQGIRPVKFSLIGLWILSFVGPGVLYFIYGLQQPLDSRFYHYLFAFDVYCLGLGVVFFLPGHLLGFIAADTNTQESPLSLSGALPAATSLHGWLATGLSYQFLASMIFAPWLLLCFLSGGTTWPEPRILLWQLPFWGLLANLLVMQVAFPAASIWRNFLGGAGIASMSNIQHLASALQTITNFGIAAVAVFVLSVAPILYLNVLCSLRRQCVAWFSLWLRVYLTVLWSGSLVLVSLAALFQGESQYLYVWESISLLVLLAGMPLTLLQSERFRRQQDRCLSVAWRPNRSWWWAKRLLFVLADGSAPCYAWIFLVGGLTIVLAGLSAVVVTRVHGGVAGTMAAASVAGLPGFSWVDLAVFSRTLAAMGFAVSLLLGMLLAKFAGNNRHTARPGGVSWFWLFVGAGTALLLYGMPMILDTWPTCAGSVMVTIRRFSLSYKAGVAVLLVVGISLPWITRQWRQFAAAPAAAPAAVPATVSAAIVAVAPIEESTPVLLHRGLTPGSAQTRDSVGDLDHEQKSAQQTPCDSADGQNGEPLAVGGYFSRIQRKLGKVIPGGFNPFFLHEWTNSVSLYRLTMSSGLFTALLLVVFISPLPPGIAPHVTVLFIWYSSFLGVVLITAQPPQHREHLALLMLGTRMTPATIVRGWFAIFLFPVLWFGGLGTALLTVSHWLNLTNVFGGSSFAQGVWYVTFFLAALILSCALCTLYMSFSGKSDVSFPVLIQIQIIFGLIYGLITFVGLIVVTDRTMLSAEAKMVLLCGILCISGLVLQAAKTSLQPSARSQADSLKRSASLFWLALMLLPVSGMPIEFAQVGLAGWLLVNAVILPFIAGDGSVVANRRRAVSGKFRGARLANFIFAGHAPGNILWSWCSAFITFLVYGGLVWYRELVGVVPWPMEGQDSAVFLNFAFQVFAGVCCATLILHGLSYDSERKLVPMWSRLVLTALAGMVFPVLSTIPDNWLSCFPSHRGLLPSTTIGSSMAAVLGFVTILVNRSWIIAAWQT